MPTDYIVLTVIGVLGIGGGLLVLREAKKYRARRILNDKRLGQAQESLTEIAAHLGVTKTAAVHIAINRLYLELFHGGAEYDFPTDEQIKEMGGSPSTMNITETQLYKLVCGKNAR